MSRCRRSGGARAASIPNIPAGPTAAVSGPGGPRGRGRRSLAVGLAAAMLGSSLAAQSLAAQSVPTRRLARPDAAFPEPFSLIRGLRELADGRVLVSDWIEERVAVLDWRTGQSRTLGGAGQGPGEYRLPSRLLALPADTTLLVDEGNQRLTLIGPDLAIGGALPRPAGVGYPFTPGAADRRGNVYFVIPGWAVGAAPGDSVTIARWDRAAGTVAPAARVRGITPRPSRDGRTMGIPYVMFAPQDAWAASPEGALLLLRSADYRLELQAGGRITRGPSNAYPTRRVTDADRTWYVRRFLATSPMSGRGPGGTMGHTPSELQTGEAIARIVRTNDFAAELPYFAAGGFWSAPDGRLFVQRTAGADGTVTLDRLDATGRIVERLTLPEGRIVLGFGRGTLYAGRADDDGLQIVERYRP